MPPILIVINNGDGTLTARLEFTGDSDKITAILENAGGYIYNVRHRIYTEDDPHE
jgi:hypothetical protein